MPRTASVSQIISPSHMAATKGATSRHPLASTRPVGATMLGPGEPALIKSAAANLASEARSIGRSLPSFETA
jgi:hypothetical protein